MEMTLGEKAYNAYGDATGWQTFNGAAMRQWSELPTNIEQAWHNVGKVMAGDLVEEIKLLEKEIEDRTEMRNKDTQEIIELKNEVKELKERVKELEEELSEDKKDNKPQQPKQSAQSNRPTQGDKK